jgi:hypothetical protein
MTDPSVYIHADYFEEARDADQEDWCTLKLRENTDAPSVVIDFNDL